jgi:putative sporulation protein YyaC
MLKYKMQGANAFLYGTLSEPVTAKEIKYVRAFLKETHKNCPIIAIDAAVGDKGDVGMIKLSDAPLMPGVGAKKQLGELGDISIMGVVAEKSIENFGILNNTRLNLVYSMAEIISDAVASLLWNREGKTAKNA